MKTHLFPQWTVDGSSDVSVPHDNLDGAGLSVVNESTGGSFTIEASPDNGTTWFPLKTKKGTTILITAGTKTRYVLSGRCDKIRATVAGMSAGTVDANIDFPPR